MDRVDRILFDPNFHKGDKTSASDGKQLLEKHLIGALIHGKRRLVELELSADVNKALRDMEAYNIMSLPIYDGEKKEYVGLLSIYDIMVFAVFGFYKSHETFVTAHDLAERKARVSDLPVSVLIGTADYLKGGWWRQNGLCIYEPTMTVWDVLDTMGMGIERVLVRSRDTEGPTGLDDGETHEPVAIVHHMLSQMDVLRFLCQHHMHFPVFAKKIHELGLDNADGHSRVVIADETEQTLTVYRTMFEQQAVAVAIVDSKTGQLASTLSPSDLRGIRLNLLGNLLLSVKDFLEKSRFGESPSPVAVTTEATLLMVATMALVAKVHRVWVVDANGKPISMVRPTDIINAVRASLL